MARIVRCDRSRPYLIQVGGQNVAICACGLSKNKPYCDGTHKITRDEEAGKLYAYDEQTKPNRCPSDGRKRQHHRLTSGNR